MKIVHSADVQWSPTLDKGPYGALKKTLGGDKLSTGLWQLPPGKKSFPMHSHLVTEEAMYVISGHAKVRTPEGETAIGPGDFVSFPPGGSAHQLINDGNEPMTFLAMSASQGVDIVEYPDSGKIAAAIGQYPTAKRFIFKKKDEAQYFDGEL